ncbi:DUF488 domain-containing protein [Lysobacter sp. LF1]|uniref:DUF488 domain-containing protein n=1 Tax=Lysobacter stagni TaxID=3045172 RepID=A0ABT6XFR6_9GAMM|nr:DUF488 family protein [Lysobacter sp. LF1]MDI9238982.1 DUF488 domain-containing protein [Lysobacter sp. LF1]
MPAPRIKRVYDAPAADDGWRVLVDRLWPRGIGKDEARIDTWLKDVAPSNELRKRFHARPELWDAFCSAYAAEVAGQPALEALRQQVHERQVTLLYAARDIQHNNAVALARILEKAAPAHGRG